MKRVTGRRPGRVRGGFTLVELVIAATIAAVVAAAVFSLFSSGVNLWNRARQESIYQDVVVLELEGVCRQLRQAVSSRRSAFKGNSSAVTFMGQGAQGMRECRYEFDATLKQLSRKQRTLAQVIEDQQIPQALRPAIQGIDACVFAYGSIDNKTRVWKWEQDWPAAKQPPLAVRVNLTRNNQTLERIVFIPVAAQEKISASIVQEGE